MPVDAGDPKASPSPSPSATPTVPNPKTTTPPGKPKSATDAQGRFNGIPSTPGAGVTTSDASAFVRTDDGTSVQVLSEKRRVDRLIAQAQAGNATAKKELDGLVVQLRGSGYKIEDYGDLSSSWSDVLDKSSLVADEMSVNEWLAATADAGGVGQNKNGSGGPYSSSSTNTTTQVNITNPSEARTVLDNALQKALGRNATKGERREFLLALNALEEDNPNVSMSQSATSGYSKGSSSTSNTRTSGKTMGGIDAGIVAEDFARSRDDYAEEQFEGYLDALTNDLVRKAGKVNAY